MRIYEEEIYCPSDMTEKPGGLQIKGFGVKPRRSFSLHTALHQSVEETADSDSELGGLLIRSPTPESPLTPWAAMISVEATNESAEDMEFVVDRLKG